MNSKETQVKSNTDDGCAKEAIVFNSTKIGYYAAGLFKCLSSLRNFTVSFLTSKSVKAFLGIKTVRKFNTNLH